jgi:hypothetical protein
LRYSGIYSLSNVYVINKDQLFHINKDTCIY